MAQVPVPPAPPPIQYAPPSTWPSPGLDVARQASGAKFFPRGEPVTRGARTTEVALSATPDGKVIGCRVIGGSGSDLLDAASCAFSKAARLRRSGGQVGQGVCCATGDVRWTGRKARLAMWQPVTRPRVLNPGDAAYPKDALRADLQGYVDYALDVDRSGRVRSCRVVQSNGHAPLERATCAFLQGKARLRPGTNRYGNPVPGKLNGRMIWRTWG